MPILFQKRGGVELDRVSKRCVEFAQKKQGNFIICYFTLDKDIVSLIKRTRIIIREIKRKLTDETYEIGSSEEGKELYKQDIIRASKYYALKEILSGRSINLIEFMEEFQEKFEFRIDFFINKLVDEKVIPISGIDPELRSSLFTYTQNYSDASIISSGIQQHNEEELILITTDKKDWTKANLELAIPEYSELAQKYRKIPEIKYI